VFLILGFSKGTPVWYFVKGAVCLACLNLRQYFTLSLHLDKSTPFWMHVWAYDSYWEQAQSWKIGYHSHSFLDCMCDCFSALIWIALHFRFFLKFYWTGNINIPYRVVVAVADICHAVFVDSAVFISDTNRWMATCKWWTWKKDLGKDIFYISTLWISMMCSKIKQEFRRG
jgi:hypothetical protein